jgi:hypothetical protein
MRLVGRQLQRARMGVARRARVHLLSSLPNLLVSASPASAIAMPCASAGGGAELGALQGAAQRAVSADGGGGQGEDERRKKRQRRTDSGADSGSAS